MAKCKKVLREGNEPASMMGGECESEKEFLVLSNPLSMHKSLFRAGQQTT